ncbi:MAG TPA: alkaline phosphatase D family protein [Opitutaceae bacterium]|nr:alkaline phosphatase D family protein [Opitutaceae bacterium]
MKVRTLLLAFAASCGALVTPAFSEPAANIAGEIGTNSALLQARITPEMRREAGISDQIEGWARFEAADNPEFNRPVVTEWIKIRPEDDYVIKYMFGRISMESLRGGRTYHWRYKFGPNPAKVTTSETFQFQTMSGALGSRPIRIAVVQGIDLASPKLGAAIDNLVAAKPDFVVFAGNSVYYDAPAASPATTADAMRAKWHALLGQEKVVGLLSGVGSYWLKDDRDFRFAAADYTAGKEPTAELGSNLFREQVPVTDPRDPASLTFRSVQATRDLALWMLEVRDYRSPNGAADNKDKSLWGTSQAEWLFRTQVSSPTFFKVMVQPTAIVGPDASPDSHVTAFRSERQAFLDHVKANDLANKGLIAIVGGDSQYHSVSAEGLEEISVGSLTTPAAVAAPAAGVKVSFAQSQPTAGFALVEVTPGVTAVAAAAGKPAVEGVPAKLTISLVNAETGAVVHKLEKLAPVATKK